MKLLVLKMTPPMIGRQSSFKDRKDDQSNSRQGWIMPCYTKFVWNGNSSHMWQALTIRFHLIQERLDRSCLCKQLFQNLPFLAQKVRHTCTEPWFRHLLGSSTIDNLTDPEVCGHQCITCTAHQVVPLSNTPSRVRKVRVPHMFPLLDPSHLNTGTRLESSTLACTQAQIDPYQSARRSM